MYPSIYLFWGADLLMTSSANTPRTRRSEVSCDVPSVGKKMRSAMGLSGIGDAGDTHKVAILIGKMVVKLWI